MTNPTTSHENITPEMKAANHAICTLASAMRDCEHCPFKPVQPKGIQKRSKNMIRENIPAKATKPAYGAHRPSQAARGERIERTLESLRKGVL